MDNSNCYWCDYLIDKINTNEEGYYCTFDPENIIPCSLELVCPRYIAVDKVPEYIRHLISEYNMIMELMTKLP